MYFAEQAIPCATGNADQGDRSCPRPNLSTQESSRMWIAFLIILVLACLVYVIFQIVRRTGPIPPDMEMDIEAYRSQLQVIEQELQHGTVDEADAELHKRDIYRRMLAAKRRSSSTRTESSMSLRAAMLASAVAFLVLIPGTYAILQFSGYLHLPDMPIKDRIEYARMLHANRPAQDDYIELHQQTGDLTVSVKPGELSLEVVRLREIAAQHKRDAIVLEALAGAEAGIGNYSEAVDAQQDVLDLLNNVAGASQHAQMAAYLVAEASGYVSPEAEHHLNAALHLDPETPLAQYFMGLLSMQTGRPDLAYHKWRGLGESLPSDDTVGTLAREGLPFAAYSAGIEHISNFMVDEQPTGGQSSTVLSISDSDSEEMIEGMVASLAARIDDMGGSAAEYGMLIVSYSVLGRVDQAKMIHDEALILFADNHEDLVVIEEAAKRAGLVE